MSSSPVATEPDISLETDLSRGERITIAVINLMVAVLGIFGNLLVIVSVITSRKLRTANNALILNLAISDLTVCMCIPWNMANLISGECIVSGTFCSLLGFVFLTSVGTSTISLMFIALNRCCLITGSFKFLRRKITLAMALMVALTWIIPFVICGIPFYTDLGEIGYDYTFSMCLWITSDPSSTTFTIILVSVCGIIPITLAAFFYLKLFLFIRSHNRKIQDSIRLPENSKGTSNDGDSKTGQQIESPLTSQQQMIFNRQVKVTKNLFIVVCVFGITLLPTSVVCFLSYPSARLLVCTVTFLLCNCCLNPIIYSKNPELRKTMANLIGCKCNLL